MQNIQIRKCEINDFQAIFPLIKQLIPKKEFNPDIMLEIFNRCLKNPDAYYLCAVVGDRLVGFCSLIISTYLAFQGETGYIRELVVDENVRNQDIGTALIEYAREQAKERGCLQLDLASALHREDAHKFYEKRGFNKTAFHYTLSSI